MAPHVEEQQPKGVNVHHDDVAEASKLGVAVEEVVAHRISEEDLMRVSADCLKVMSGDWRIFTPAGWRVFGLMFVMAVNQAGYGIDWGVIGGLNSMKLWHSYFGFGNTGAILGTINALMQIGLFCGAPFLALSDVIGRRGINFLGNAITIVAALLQGLAPNLPCFMIGRFLLGVGASLCSAPQYIAEVAPLHLRGRIVGIFGAFFHVGSMCMTGLLMGFTKINNDWQWRAPLLLEGFFPVILCTLIYILCPESPRYYVMKGRQDKARRAIARYMTTNDDENAPIVPLMIAQIEESLETSRAGVLASYDFRPFFTRAAGYRTMLIIIYSCFQQWNGGGVIGYYLSPALDTVGIHDSLDQLGIQLGEVAVYFIFTFVGAWLIDRMRRRTLIFSGLISFVLCQTAATITSWQYSLHKSKATAVLTVVWFYIYQVCSASLIATMHNLYPVELLSLTLRSKGMGLYNMIQGAAGVVNTYGISVGIGKIGYKIWVVYIVYNTIQLIISYFVFPETSKLSLEEIDTIFETPGVHPVKMSLKIEQARKERLAIEREEANAVQA
ncbi:uncharacterized protein E0L32_010369 [Thyridium curvatum]|uniref:Major facilitator superfamily (MFS) profile domain-containing protein n=1 Tax=Thyridium curvatum TaxID=1093900 RepID=A0A507ANJ5_9PEZI|nr:uncharacterized protein E0L32_010369 [Thyridium curvatum]TPX07914.1 hypothetical protein E0L32_010369 [Thyridium curvatum]